VVRGDSADRRNCQKTQGNERLHQLLLDGLRRSSCKARMRRVRNGPDWRSGKKPEDERSF
jgi:hypothetical protein